MRERSQEIERLYAEHAKEVTKLTWLLGVTRDEVEDVTQEVWLAAYRTVAKRYNPNRRAWLFTITHGAVKTWRRTRKRRPEWSNDPDDGAEMVDVRTPETELDDQRRAQAARAFLQKAIPDDARRDALVLHEGCGMTVKDVAEATGVSVVTAAWRLRMARRDLERAKARMSAEEREKLRTLVVPFASVDEILDALRTPADSLVSDEEVARGWDRLASHIALDGDGDGDGQDGAPGDPPTTPAQLGVPSGYALGGGKLLGALAVTFFAGALSGAAVLYAVLSHHRAREASFIMTETPAPVPAPQPAPEPAPSATAAPPVRRSIDTGTAWEAAALLNQARAALEEGAPARALELTRDHANRFPKRTPAKREEVAIRALLDLHRRDEAEARAAKLVRSAPSSGPVMEALFGHPLL